MKQNISSADWCCFKTVAAVLKFMMRVLHDYSWSGAFLSLLVTWILVIHCCVADQMILWPTLPTFFFPPLYDLNILQGSYLCYFGRVPCFYFCRINCKMLFKLLKVPHLMKMEKCHSPFHIFFLVNPHHLTSHSSLGFLKFQCWVSSHFRFPV